MAVKSCACGFAVATEFDWASLSPSTVRYEALRERHEMVCCPSCSTSLTRAFCLRCDAEIVDPNAEHECPTALKRHRWAAGNALRASCLDCGLVRHRFVNPGGKLARTAYIAPDGTRHERAPECLPESGGTPQ